MSDILKTKLKSKIMRHNIVDEYVTHTMTSRIMNPVCVRACVRVCTYISLSWKS